MKRNAVLLMLSFLVVIFIVAPFMGQTNKKEEDSVNVNLSETESNSGVSQNTICNTNPPMVTEKTTEESTEKPLEYNSYWVSASRLNVRKSPNVNSDVLKKISYSTKVKAAEYNSQWLVLSDGGYVSKEFLSENEIKYISYEAPYTNGFKSFMSYKALSPKSKQGVLQQSCYTGQYGIRQYDGRFCVAIGSHFGTSIGQYFDLVLENGTIIPCIMADQKANCHTDASNIVTVSNGCMTEFVVDFSSLNPSAKRMGDMSYCVEEWQSRVVEVRVYEQVGN